MPITEKELAENYPLSVYDAAAFALRTQSSRAFYFTVVQALAQAKKAPIGLSVVRMGDGERQLLLDCAMAKANHMSDTEVMSFDVKWRERMGILGITYTTLNQRIADAITSAQYFAPNVNGLANPHYSLYPWFRQADTTPPPLKTEPRKLVDNFFVNEWDLDQRCALLKQAGQVLVLHRNPVTATTFAKRARAYLNVGIRHIHLASWRDAEAVVAECAKWGADFPLVLVSAGPGSKHIIPKIANQGKVVLDLGNAMDHWLLLELYHADPSKLTEVNQGQ